MSIDLIGRSLILERCQSQDYLIHSSHLARAANIHFPKNALVFAFFMKVMMRVMMMMMTIIRDEEPYQNG